ncbi:MAG: DUF5680 domain-containing protein [Patescibacteria group bacterium]
MLISDKELMIFLGIAKKATYANQLAPKAKSLRPASEDYHYEQDGLIYHDTYFGSRDFIGEEIVYKDNQPIWGMNYCGYIIESQISTREAYKILRPALMADCEDILPVRGPKEFMLKDSLYLNKISGEINRFFGEENIYLNNKLVYYGRYHGGRIV